MDQEMARVQIELSDQAGRKHILTACFPPAFPNVPFTVEPLAVPQCDKSNKLDQDAVPTNQLSLTNGSSLRDAVRQAEKVGRQGLFDVVSQRDVEARNKEPFMLTQPTSLFFLPA